MSEARQSERKLQRFAFLRRSRGELHRVILGSESRTVEQIHEQPSSTEHLGIRGRQTKSSSTKANNREVGEPDAQASFSRTAAPPRFPRRLLRGTPGARQYLDCLGGEWNS